MEQGKSRLIASAIIGLAILLSVTVLGNAFKHRNDGPKTISVKGGAERDFTSDLIVWNVTIKSHADSPLYGFKDIERQKTVLSNFLTTRGVTEDEFVFGPVSYREDVTGYYDKNQERYVEIKNGFIVEQTVTLTSNRVDDVEKVIRSVGDLIEQDVVAEPEQPRYYYTKLADLKLEMVEAASEDARARAKKIASKSKSSLGGLREANLGVFQIVGKHAEEDYSWGGNFNTTSKEKTVSITLSAEFLVK